MIKPLRDYLLIEPTEATHPSGLIVPDTAKEKPQEGKVVAMGEDNPNIRTDYVVIYKRWEGTEVQDNEKTYLLVKEEDILAVKE